MVSPPCGGPDRHRQLYKGPPGRLQSPGIAARRARYRRPQGPGIAARKARPQVRHFCKGPTVSLIDKPMGNG